MSDDTRVVYGARCFWWDDIKHTALTNGRIPIPCCPHCGSVLFEAPDEQDFLSSAYKWTQLRPVPRSGYLDLLKWSKGRCFPSREHAAYIYFLETNIFVDVRDNE